MRLILVLTFLLCGCGLQKSELDETLEWMDNTYNPHPKESGSYGHGRTAWYTPLPDGTEFMWSGLMESFKYTGCEMTLKTEDLPEAKRSEELRSSCVIRFNLKDIDPTSFKVTDRSHRGDFSCEQYSDEERRDLNLDCDHTELSFSTTTGAGLVHEDWIHIFPKLTGPSHENRNSDNSSRSYFEFDDPTYARRFAKAFARAIQLCGGRPSPF
jgi:hypothetical protein